MNLIPVTLRSSREGKGSSTEAHYVQISPHVYAGPLLSAAAVQIGTCCPNFLIMEGVEQFGGFHARLLKDPLTWCEGYAIPSDRPRPRP